MTAKGYATVTTTGQVAAWYGSTLSAEQAVQAAAWLEAAEGAIDAATQHPYLTGAVVGERHTLDGPLLYLRQRPVASVTSVTGYQRASMTGTALTLTEQYEEDDLAQGRLYLPVWRMYAYVLVSYTPVATVPAAVSEATAALLADWLTSDLATSSAGTVIAKRLGDVEIRYASDTSTSTATVALPDRVRQLLAPYLPAVTFA